MPYEDYRSLRLRAGSESFGDAHHCHRARAVIVRAVPDAVLDCAFGYCASRAGADRPVWPLSHLAFSVTDVIVVRAERDVCVFEFGVRAFNYSHYVASILS